MSEQQRDKSVDLDTAAGETALNWALARGSGERVAARSLSRRRRRRRIRHIAAGSLAVVTLTAAALVWRLRPVPSVDALGVRNPPSIVVAAPARQTLPDGSTAELKDGSRINIAYGSDARRVILAEGEAHFEVTKNEIVPFIVVAGGVEVRAIGTAFSVQVAAGQVGVLVTEGRVAVDQPALVHSADQSPGDAGHAATSRTLATVDAGNRVLLELAALTPPSVVPVTPSEQKEILSWRVPRIELSGTPLSEVLAVFNRHGTVRLSLADPALGRLQLSGVLRPDNPSALLHVLKVEFGLEADRSADGAVIVRRP